MLCSVMWCDVMWNNEKKPKREWRQINWLVMTQDTRTWHQHAHTQHRPDRAIAWAIWVMNDRMNAGDTTCARLSLTCISLSSCVWCYVRSCDVCVTENKHKEWIKLRYMLQPNKPKSSSYVFQVGHEQQHQHGQCFIHSRIHSLTTTLNAKWMWWLVQSMNVCSNIN